MKTLRRILLALLVATGGGALPAQTAANRTPPRPLEMPAPTYPPALTDSGQDGTAVIMFTVAADGTVQDAAVRSTDHPAFGEAALAALQRWRFQPGTRDGQPAPVKVSQPFKFNAPPEQKINAAAGRKVFQKLEVEPIAAARLPGGLQLKSEPPMTLPAVLAGKTVNGPVEVEFVVTPAGEVVNPQVLSQASGELTVAAILHVARMRFEPPVLDGLPVHVLTTHTLTFP